MARQAKAPKDEQIVHLQRLQDVTIEIPIVGSTPVIPHAWAEKAKAMMREKHQKPGVRTKRQAQDPEQEAHDSCYWLNDKPAMPAAAFKAATVSGCRFFEGMTMTKAKGLFYILGEGQDQLVPLEAEGEMFESTPRNESGVVDLRYRYRFFPWQATLRVQFISGQLDADSVVALVDAGGRAGVGDWRPSSPKSATGTYGQYRVDDERM